MSVRKTTILIAVAGGALFTGALLQHLASVGPVHAPTRSDSSAISASQAAPPVETEGAPDTLTSDGSPSRLSSASEPSISSLVNAGDRADPERDPSERTDRHPSQGRVTDEARHPVENAEVSFAGRGGKQPMSALSDAQGEFHVTLEPGDYAAVATATGYLPERRFVSVGNGAEALDFVLHAAGAIFGTVEGLSGSDVQPLLVRVVPVLSSSLAEERAEGARVDADSTYEVSGLEEGMYRVYLDGDSPENGVEVFLRAGDRVRADVRLAAGTIEGVVELPAGRTLGAFLLGLSYAETGRQTRLDVPLAAGGRFSVKGLPLGRVVVTASAEGIATSPHTTLTLRSGTPSRVKFDLSGGQVKGTVVDGRTGESIAGAAVSVITLDPQWHRVDSMTIVATATSDQDGSFGVSGLAAGEYALVARAPRHAIGTLQFSSNGSDPTPLVVALDPGMEVEVVVMDAAGRVEPGASVMIDRQPSLQGTSYSERTDDTGVARFSDFSSGEFLITVLHGQSERARALGVGGTRTQRVVEITPASRRIVIHQED